MRKKWTTTSIAVLVVGKEVREATVGLSILAFAVALNKNRVCGEVA